MALLLGLFSSTSFAASTNDGPRTASSSAQCTNVTGTGTVAWTSPGDAYSLDGTSATASVDGTSTNYLRCIGFGFSIPSNVTVEGITVGVYRQSSSTGNGGSSDNAVRMVKSGSIQTTNKATTDMYPTSLAWANYGGTTDLWGTTWTSANVNSATFGVAFSAQKASGAGAAHTVSVDNITVTVTYSVDPTFTQSSYQWFENVDSAAPVPVGAQLGGAARNTAATAPSDGSSFRLRAAIHVGDSDATGGIFNFTLQYALRGADNLCDTGFVGESYFGVTTYSQIAYAANANAADGDSLATNANDPQHGTDTLVYQSFEETNTFTLSNTTTLGQDALWDFILKDNGAAPGTTYCLRIVANTSTLLSSYSVIPEITTPLPNVSQSAYQWFNGQNAASENNFLEKISGLSFYSKALIQTSDDAYVMGGEDGGAVLSKLNASGRTVWETKFGTSSSIHSVIQTSDGGYAAVGITDEYGAASSDSFLAKFDSAGSLSWLKRWGGASNDSAISVAQSSDGGYIVVGSTRVGSFSDAAFTKLDSAGDIIWQKSIGGASTDIANTVATTPDGGYVVGGTYSGGTGFVLKIDMSGNLVWSNLLPNTGGPTDVASIAIDTDGSIVAAGKAYGIIGSSDAFVVKFSADGVYDWGQAFGESDYESAVSISISGDGSYYVSGATYSVGPSTANAFVSKLANNGDLEWSRQINTDGETESQSVAATKDGGVAAVGINIDDTTSFLAKYSANGTLYKCPATTCTETAFSTGVYTPSLGPTGGTITTNSYSSAIYTPSTTSPSLTMTPLAGTMTFAKTIGGISTEDINAIEPTSDGGYIVVGASTTYAAGAVDAFIAKFDKFGDLSWARQWGDTGIDNAVDVAETSDGGFVLVGSSDSSYGPGGVNALMVKYTSAGIYLWDNLWGGSFEDRATAVTPRSDGGFAIAGFSDTLGGDQFESVAVIFDVDGNESSATSIGDGVFGTYTDWATDIVTDANDGLVICGYYFDSDNTIYKPYIINIDYFGAELWSYTWEPTLGSAYAYGLTNTSDRGYAVTGKVSGSSGSDDTLLIKYAENGDLEFSKVWDSTVGGDEMGDAIVQTDDGGYAIYGSSTLSSPSGTYGLLLKTDSLGEAEFAKGFGDGDVTIGKSLFIDEDGGYMTAGDTTDYGAGARDGLIVKYDANGQLHGCSSAPCITIPGSSDDESSVNQVGFGAPSGIFNSLGYATLTGSAISPGVAGVVSEAIWANSGPTIDTPLKDPNTIATSSRHDAPLRLRVTLSNLLANKIIGAQSMSLKVQVSPRVGTCDASFTGEVYVDVGPSAPFDYYDNPSLTGGTFMLPGVEYPVAPSGLTLRGHYYEGSGFTISHKLTEYQSEAIDLSLSATDEAIYGNYCFRIINTDSRTLSGYTQIASIFIPPAPSQQLRHGKFFDERNSAGLVPFYW